MGYKKRVVKHEMFSGTKIEVKKNNIEFELDTDDIFVSPGLIARLNLKSHLHLFLFLFQN